MPPPAIGCACRARVVVDRESRVAARGEGLREGAFHEREVFAARQRIERERLLHMPDQHLVDRSELYEADVRILDVALIVARVLRNRIGL